MRDRNILNTSKVRLYFSRSICFSTWHIIVPQFVPYAMLSNFFCEFLCVRGSVPTCCALLHVKGTVFLEDFIRLDYRQASSHVPANIPIESTAENEALSYMAHDMIGECCSLNDSMNLYRTAPETHARGATNDFIRSVPSCTGEPASCVMFQRFTMMLSTLRSICPNLDVPCCSANICFSFRQANSPDVDSCMDRPTSTAFALRNMLPPERKLSVTCRLLPVGDSIDQQSRMDRAPAFPRPRVEGWVAVLPSRRF